MREGGCRRVFLEEVGEGNRGQALKGFVSKKEAFVDNQVLYREPV